uniref:FA complementation group E n=1 Tax=Sphenodon punctatus TaxID=8508 RepID=A0A8D0H8M2_SPHPU
MMEAPWLWRFDKPSRLLLHTLMSRPCGTLAALRALQRTQSTGEPGQGFRWEIFSKTLCTQEPVLEGPEKTLALKPLLLLLPLVCQRNLFSLLHVVQSSVPKDCLSCLLQASRQDPHPDLWVHALGDLLQRRLQKKSCLSPVPLSNGCQQQLRGLCQKIVSSGHDKSSSERKLNWFVDEWPGTDLGPVEDTHDSASQARKRKKTAEELQDPERERQRKRSRLEEEESEVDPAVGCAPWKETNSDSIGNELTVAVSGNETVQSQTTDVNQSSLQVEVVEVDDVNESCQRDTSAKVPDFIKLHVPRLKNLLEMELDQSDGTAPPELQVLNECTPGQLEGLCSLLQLSACPEHTTLQFCTCLLLLSPDLSYSNAAVLTGELFLQRILSLTKPASSSLVTALTLFCSKYARPVCCILFPPVLQASGKGPERTKLLCTLIEECLEPEYVRLVFSQVLEIPWSEELLTVVHSLLGRQLELPPELFNRLVLNLCQLAQELTKSMNYAKLVLTLLNKYRSSITSTHLSSLSCVLELNNTILKKSLQAALRQVALR